MTLWRRANPEKAKAAYKRDRAQHGSAMDASSKQSRAARMDRRREMLNQFPCVCCGEADPTVIQWHHVEPETKEFNLFCSNWPEEKFWDEVLKCVPVCANCHIKIHKQTLCLINPIGFKHP